MRRICMTSDDFLPAATGVGIQLQHVSRDLARRGHYVSIITTRRKGQPAFETWHGIYIYRTFTICLYGFFLSLPSVTKIRQILKKIKPDVIHHHWMGLLMKRTMKAAEGIKIPHVYTYHMTVEHVTQPWYMKPLIPIVHQLHLNLCNKADLVLAPSRTLADRVRQLNIAPPVRYLSNPVALKGQTAVRHECKNRPFVILYVGQLNPVKNLPYLLKAFAALVQGPNTDVSQEYNDAELWIVGEGNLRQSLETLCRNLRIESKVTFHGFVKHEHLGNHYSACDVFVLPSTVETQGMVAMEAMRFGKPIIVTRSIVSARELVDHGKNGFIVNTDSVTDLTDRLLTLQRRPELREAMGRASRIKSGAFSVERIVDQLERYYHHADILSRHSFDGARRAAWKVKIPVSNAVDGRLSGLKEVIGP